MNTTRHTMTMHEAMDASRGAHCAFAVMEDLETLIVVDALPVGLPEQLVYRMRQVRHGRLIGIPCLDWPCDALEQLSHNGCWYPLIADRCIF